MDITDNITLKVPYGTRDSLPDETRKKRAVKEKLSRLFNSFGYEEVETPIVEYLDTLTMGSAKGDEENMLKLISRGETLALRHEMTTPIARMAVSRLSDSPLPLKLCYIANVYRQEETQAGRQCEFCQAGVELMGSSAAAADAEVVALCVRAIDECSLNDYRVFLGHIGFVQGLMTEYGINADAQRKIKKAMERRDLVKTESIIDTLDIDKTAKRNLKKMPWLIGGEDILTLAENMANNETSSAAVNNLREIYKLLKVYGAADAVSFDLGITRDFGYYTGAVFEVYAKGLGFPLAGGGRYDNMLADFGSSCPATGFSLGVDRLCERGKAGKKTPPPPRFMSPMGRGLRKRL